ncbi:MAG: hypothetical protein ACPGUC_04695 [Gammaproteobacteria bacterium]
MASAETTDFAEKPDQARSGHNMARLHQLNILFQPGEDRLLLRVRMDDGGVINLWLTRRYTRMLWKTLNEMSEAYAAEATPAQGEALAAVKAFQQEQALAGSNFGAPYKDGADEDASFPLGRAPVLLTRIAHKINDQGVRVVSMGPEKGAMIDIACDVKLLHSLIKLVSDGVARADWDLDIALALKGGNMDGSVPDGVVRH